MSTHPVLKQFADVPPGLFSGPDFDQERDEKRLLTQVGCVLVVTMDGRWRTVERLCAELSRKYPAQNFPAPSVSAQLRNIRKLGYIVNRRYVPGTGGLFEYQVLPAAEVQGG
jgi:hypothetical protein